MTDLSDLLKKLDGDELSAQEFVRLVTAVTENQDAVKMIDSKVGYVLKKKDGALMLHFFKDKAMAESWEEMPSEENQPLCSVEIPESGEGSVSYRMGVDTDGVESVETSTRDVAIRLRVTSRRYDPILQVWTDTREQCTITVQRQLGDGAFQTVATLVNQNTVAYDGGRYMTLNMKDYLDNGEQTIRISARGYETGETNSAVVNVTVAEMGLSFGTRWEEPFVKDDDDPSTGKVNIGFKMRGSVNKELNYEFYNAEGVRLDYGKIEVGTAEYDQSNYNLQLNHTGLVGLYRVKAWLNYANSSIETEPVEQMVMLSVKGSEEVLVVVNNVESPVVNWSSQHVMDYAVYNPNAQDGESDVALVLKDTEGEKTWMTTNVAGVKNGVRYDYSPYLSIENYDSEGQKVKLFASRLHILVDNVEKRVLTLSVDNTNDFAPTVGANFVIIPSMRSNNDTDRMVIRNESALETEPKTIEAEWNGVLFENDGWVSEKGVKRLRILAGTSVRIPYECYSNKTKTDGLTMEFDLSVRNIADEEAEVLTVGKMTDDGFVGLKVTGKRAVMYKAEDNVDYFQDIEWQEGERTHIAVNIMPRLTVNGRDLRVVRMFINGKINREFTYTANDNFWDGVGSDGIVVGGTGADVDVYGMRVFKDKMVASSEVLNDYVASLSDVDTKLAIIEANNIMEGGVISYRKAKGKYNVLVWKGRYPSKLQQSDTVGDLMIDIVDDPAHSGVINAMSCKGQGSSSKKYLLWNGTFAFGEDSVWVDGNGNEHGAYYQLTNRSPRMTKTVGKLNWASSMQSHKMGLTAMYQDLYNDIFDGTAGYEPNGITTIPGYENTRIAVEEKAFLFFVQEDESKDPVYYGNMTWGSAKGDKMTFGYDNNHEQLKNYLMLEGSDQTPKLTLYQVPWFADEVTYNEKEEYYQYNGFGSWDVTLGNRESVDKFIEKHNFVFSYSTRLMYWNGNLTSLQKADEDTADRSYQYFIVGQSYGNFNVYRYDWLKKEWVNAGVTKDENGDPVAVNLNTQLGLSVSEANADFEAVLATFKAGRVAKFREGIGRYVHVNDFLFTMQFLKFVGASDNRAKNTYEYYDPVGGLIRQAQDDLDSVLRNNNQGQKQKPYWVEEHDFDSRQMFNGYFWAGSGNAMYNTFEDAYGKELRGMMAKIMASMARLGGGDVMGCWERYFFAIQDYFPVVAYNECARLWYEYAKTLYDAGEYTNDTDPITQSLGDLKECEMEWVKNRIVYMASYCEYASALGESIEFRQMNSSEYRLTPAMKMYVYMGLGTSSVYPMDGNGMPKRCDKGEEAVFDIVGSGDSIQTEIRAVGLMQSLGDLSKVAVSGSTNFSAGKRLGELKIGDANASGVKFNPSSVNSFPENAVSIDMTNCGSQLTQIGSLTDLNKLEVLKAKGTGVTLWVLPQNNKLKVVELPDGVRTLEIRNQMNLETLDVDTSALKSLTMGKVKVDVQAFVEEWLEGIEGGLEGYSVVLDGVNFTGFSAENMMKLVGMGICKITGRIEFNEASVTAEQLGIIRSKLSTLIDSGNLNLVYTNTISLELDNPSFVAGYGSVHCKAEGLSNNDLWLDFDTLDGLLYVDNEISTTVNGCRIYECAIKAHTIVDNSRTIEVRATDGVTISPMARLTVQKVSKATSVTIKTGAEYLDEAYVGKMYEYGAEILPNGYSKDLVAIEWHICEVKAPGYTLVDQNGVSYIYDDNDADKTPIIKLINGGKSTQKIEVTQLIPAKNNNTSFVIECIVTNNVPGSNVLRATFNVIAHAWYEEFAAQCFSEEDANYNPALMIILNSHIGENGLQLTADPETGVYNRLTKKQAAAVTTIGNWFQNKTTIVDSDNIVGAGSDAEYNFEDFTQFKDFTGVTLRLIDVPFNNCSKLKSIYIPDGQTEAPAKGYITASCSSIEKIIIGKSLRKLWQTSQYGGGSGYSTSFPNIESVRELVFMGTQQFKLFSAGYEYPLTERVVSQLKYSKLSILRFNNSISGITTQNLYFRAFSDSSAWKQQNTNVYIPMDNQYHDTEEPDDITWMDMYDVLFCAFKKYGVNGFIGNNEYNSKYLEDSSYCYPNGAYPDTILDSVWNDYNGITSLNGMFYHNVCLDADGVIPVRYAYIGSKCSSFSNFISQLRHCPVHDRNTFYKTTEGSDNGVLLYRNAAETTVYTNVVFVGSDVNTLIIPEGVTTCAAISARAWNKVSFPNTMTTNPSMGSITCQEMYIPNSFTSMNFTGTITKLFVGNEGGTTLPITNSTAFTATNLYVRRPIEGTNRISGTNAHVENLQVWNQCTGVAGYQHLYLGETNDIISGIIDINFNVRDYFLSGNSDIQAINVYGAVDTIGSYAFANCSNLLQVKITDAFSGNLSYTCYGCSKLVNFYGGNALNMDGAIPGDSRTVPYFKPCNNYTLRGVSANFSVLNIITEKVNRLTYVPVGNSNLTPFLCTIKTPPVYSVSYPMTTSYIKSIVGDAFDSDENEIVMNRYKTASNWQVSARSSVVSLYSYANNSANLRQTIGTDTSAGDIIATNLTTPSIIISTNVQFIPKFGDRIKIKAVPKEGYKFVRWSFAEDIFAEESYIEAYVPLAITAFFEKL